jgi:hypothetical protein
MTSDSGVTVESNRPAADDEQAVMVEAITRSIAPLYGDRLAGLSMVQVLMKAAGTPDASSASTQGINKGRREHPFDYSQVTLFQTANEHHSACIRAKVSATVGLGFLTPEEIAKKIKGDAIVGGPKRTKADEILDPLCDHSWQDVMTDAGEDFWQVGPCYIEVVRSDGKKITGIHHVPAKDVHVVVEDAINRHFEVCGEGTSPKLFAEYGDLDGFKARGLGTTNGFTLTPEQAGSTAEIIQIRQPSSLSKIYGFPDWISCVAAIELIQCLRQYKYDFFNNRGVPEFLLFVLGQRLADKEWKVIVDALKSNIGKGNSHKSVALNLPNDQIKIVLEKLALEGKSDDSLDKTNETYQLAIVTAHGVPPLLAGIQIPGKLGATNELPNAIRCFQLLRCGPAQRIFQQKLGATLGNKDLNGGLGLGPDDFILRAITDEINLQAMDTSTQMRQTETDAANQGRDLNAGLKG